MSFVSLRKKSLIESKQISNKTFAFDGRGNEFIYIFEHRFPWNHGLNKVIIQAVFYVHALTTIQTTAKSCRSH